MKPQDYASEVLGTDTGTWPFLIFTVLFLPPRVAPIFLFSAPLNLFSRRGRGDLSCSTGRFWEDNPSGGERLSGPCNCTSIYRWHQTSPLLPYYTTATNSCYHYTTPPCPFSPLPRRYPPQKSHPSLSILLTSVSITQYPLRPLPLPLHFPTTCLTGNWSIFFIYIYIFFLHIQLNRRGGGGGGRETIRNKSRITIDRFLTPDSSLTHNYNGSRWSWSVPSAGGSCLSCNPPAAPWQPALPLSREKKRKKKVIDLILKASRLSRDSGSSVIPSSSPGSDPPANSRRSVSQIKNQNQKRGTGRRRRSLHHHHHGFNTVVSPLSFPFSDR